MKKEVGQLLEELEKLKEERDVFVSKIIEIIESIKNIDAEKKRIVTEIIQTLALEKRVSEDLLEAQTLELLISKLKELSEK